MLNLLTDSCFPVVHQDGTEATIAFAEITRDYATNPIVDFALPRADLQASAYQLGIAWLQTAFAPESDRDWQRFFLKPPDPATLHQQFEPYAAAFKVWDETEPCFMQDFDQLAGDERSVHTLFIEAPGGNTLKNNADHFIKRHQIKRLSPFAAALTLFCLQTHAPSGGQGHRTGLRGGGPLTSIPKGPTLWSSLWLSVMTFASFTRNTPNPARWSHRPEPEEVFPWLQATVSSKPQDACVFHGQVHPLQVYWAMPRRIRLQAPVAETGMCDLTQKSTEGYFENYITLSYGNNYQGGWQHPLTPHYLDKDGQALPRHGQPGSFAFQHWLGLIFEEEKKNGGNLPAEIVRIFLNTRRHLMKKVASSEMSYRLWVFGYDMDNMKARSWIEALMPLPLPSGDLASFSQQVKDFIDAAKHVANATRQAYVKATVGRSGKTRGDVSFVDARFWENTETAFYERLQELSSDPMQTQSAQRWLKQLFYAATALFDELTEIRPVDCDPIDPNLWAKARSDLVKFTHYHGKKMRARVKLPPRAQKQGDT